MTDNRPEELTPLDVILLEEALGPFCPVVVEGGQYHPGLCLPNCYVCEDLLRKRGDA